MEGGTVYAAFQLSPKWGRADIPYTECRPSPHFGLMFTRMCAHVYTMAALENIPYSLDQKPLSNSRRTLEVLNEIVAALE